MLNSTEKLIQALRSPACYSHPVSHVMVIETHISYIVLTGPYAYKIKKPVDLGFLDFSTLEKRRFYCEEELRLNRRLAPDIYLDVVAITGSAEHPGFEQNGSPIEYAVKMRQFPQEAMLDTLLEGGGVTPQHIDALADEIAQFHRSLPSSPPESLFGTVGVIRHPAIENFDQIRSLLPPQESTPLLGQLETWTE
jgi:aminoglycoside phosphotransferase family enzyme